MNILTVLAFVALTVGATALAVVALRRVAGAATRKRGGATGSATSAEHASDTTDSLEERLATVAARLRGLERQFADFDESWELRFKRLAQRARRADGAAAEAAAATEDPDQLAIEDLIGKRHQSAPTTAPAPRKLAPYTPRRT